MAIIIAVGIGSVLSPPPFSPAEIAIAATQSGARVTQALENYLRKRITSPGGELNIKITPGTKSDQGYLKDVLIVAKPARIKKKQFSLLRLHATNVHIDPRALLDDNDLETISSTTTLYAEVTDEELTRALAGGKKSSVMNLKVNFRGNLIQVSGNYNWGIFSGPFTATGNLRLAPGHQIVADIQSLKINGFEAPAFIKQKFSERINPLIDYTDLPFKPPFRKLVIQGNKAIVYA
jgi:hypothetical protein